MVDDFPAMRARMEELAGVDPILPWLADGQFVFLGAADYDRAPDGTLDVPRGYAGSACSASTTGSTRRRCRATGRS